MQVRLNLVDVCVCDAVSLGTVSVRNTWLFAKYLLIDVLSVCREAAECNG